MPLCTLCPRLVAHCRNIAGKKKAQFSEEVYWGKPVPAFGDHNARLMIVGLAPAAHGANRTGRIFTGDSSGDWLYDALHRFGFANQPQSRHRNDGLLLKDCFITAAARCAPPQNKPSSAELDNCRPYLAAETALLANVKVVLVLGRIAYERWLKASGWWDQLSASDRPKFSHGAESLLPDGKLMVCSYHPSRQNTNTGRLTREMWYGVFRRCRTVLDSA